MRHPVPKITSLAFLLAAISLGTPALADRPEWAGRGKGAQPQTGEESPTQWQGTTRDMYAGQHFDDRQRTLIRNYYAGQFRAGHCPPGLAKKNTGCMPPGQAKKWAIGQPLPRDLAYEDLPPRILTQMGTPPAGYRYVRVASDILLIAVGTSMVVDAIEDLGRQ